MYKTALKRHCRICIWGFKGGIVLNFKKWGGLELAYIVYQLYRSFNYAYARGKALPVKLNAFYILRVQRSRKFATLLIFRKVNKSHSKRKVHCLIKSPRVTYLLTSTQRLRRARARRKRGAMGKGLSRPCLWTDGRFCRFLFDWVSQRVCSA